MRVLSRFDTFAKAEDHVQLRTLGGGIVSIVAALIMIYLVISEFLYYGAVERTSHVTVNSASDLGDILVSIDIELHGISCSEANIKVQTKRGDHLDVDLQKTLAGDDGCRLDGEFPIPRVAGIFQISSKPLTQNSNFFFSMLGLSENVNASHTVHHLSFGPEFEGMVFPLDGVSHMVNQELAHFQYTINVVPTVFRALGDDNGLQSFQYSVTETRQDSDFMGGVYVHPGIFFKYDFSPLLIELRETQQPFTAFLTSICAILGGILTCSGCINTCTYHTAQEIKKLA